MKTLYTLGYNKTVINLTEAKKTQDYPDGVWRADLKRIPKLRTYKTHKAQVKYEGYVLLNMQKCERSFMAGILP